MATAITEDFVTKNGIVVQGTGTVTSSTGQSNALQVNGGAAIAANLIVGSTATINGNLSVGSYSYLNGLVTATGVVSITATANATSTTTGALVVTNGVGIGGSLYVGNSATILSSIASTSSISQNALYIAGGVGIAKSLFVQGPAVFANDVTFTGATTNVYSTNTVYTDNLIEIHVPSNSTEWLVNDGKDIGLRFHYFSNTGSNAALVLSNATKYLEWFGSGAETNTGTFSSATYGTFKTGSILLTSTASTINTSSGALQVVGGIGVNGAVYGGSDISGSTIIARNLTQGRVVLAGINGQLTDFSGLTYNTLTNTISANVAHSTSATNLDGGASGSVVYQSNTGTTTFLPIGTSGYVLQSSNGLPAWVGLGNVATGRATTSSNIDAGSDTLIPFQNGIASTTFKPTFAFDYNNDTLRTVNAVFTGTTNANNTISGALQVVGGVGIGRDVYIGGNETVAGDLTVNGGDIFTNATTFTLVNTTATTVNFAGSATTITIGVATGTTTIRSATTITNSTNAISTTTGALTVVGGVGIGSDVYIGGQTNVTKSIIPTNSSPSLGSLAYPFKDLFLSGNSLYVGNLVLSSSGTTATFANSSGTSNISVGALIVTTTTNATNTQPGALQVAGGVSIGKDLYIGGHEIIAGDLWLNGGNIYTTATIFSLINTTATTVNFAGSATTITIGAATGSTTIGNATTLTNTTNATNTLTGALTVAGGVGIQKDLYVGGNLNITGNETLTGDLEVRGGDITTNQTTFNLLNATASTINFAGAGTAITIGTTTGYTEIKNATTLSNATISISTNSGALQVRGGAGIGGNLYIGGISNLQALSATVTTATSLNVTNAAAIGGILSANENSNATLSNNGALRVTGGAGISKDLVVGGLITAGTTQAASVGTAVPSLYSNNNLISSFTSNVLSTSTQASLDTFSSTSYRSAKYFIQIVDGTNIQLSEISIFHDGSKAYLSEYGISTNNGQLGTWDATWDATNITIKFTPNNPTAMTIKMTRTTMTF